MNRVNYIKGNGVNGQNNINDEMDDDSNDINNRHIEAFKQAIKYIHADEGGLHVLNYIPELDEVICVHIEPPMKECLMMSRLTEKGFMNRVLTHHGTCCWESCVLHVALIQQIA